MPLPEVPSKWALNADRPFWSEDAIWHYTTAEGLKGILTDHVLWASSAAFMNDRKELSTGPDTLLKILEFHKSALDPEIVDEVTRLARATALTNRPQTFVACASKDGDNLTMWRNYTGAETGFAIGLHSSEGLKIRSQRAIDVNQLNLPDGRGVLDVVHDVGTVENETFPWRPTIYDLDAQGQAAIDGLRRFEKIASGQRVEEREPAENELDAMADISQKLQAFKHPAFHSENEYRIVCDAPPYAGGAFIKHRAGKYGIVPYVELGIPKPRDGEGRVFPDSMGMLPLMAIVVGPTPYPEEAAAGATDLLRACGYEGVRVSHSQVPFRR